MRQIELFMLILIIVVFSIYIIAFYNIILKGNKKRYFLRRYHNAVCSIYEEACKIEHENLEYLFEQLNINYEKLCQTNPNNNYSSILDLLEMIIHHYDSYSNSVFKNIYCREKEAGIRNFLAKISCYIKNGNPFISAPIKEASLMQSIMDALDNQNTSLGISSLKQLSQEIVTKEKILIKKDKANEMANIVSIVGIILTVFFGILSFLN